MSKGFSLVEMLVVIGIIAILSAASLGGYSYVTRKTEQARGRELVSNTATALTALFQKQNRWPPSMLTAAQGEGRLDARAAAALAYHKLMSLSYTTVEEDGEQIYTLSGLDRCGIVSPWAAQVIKKQPKNSSALSAKVPSGGTVRDHQLHFALDDDGDGITEAKIGSKTVRVRANALVWSWGRNGREDPYDASMSGRGDADDIYSWTRTQEVR